ncbi:MAG: DUF58 domain-containing protein [Candidatus Aenigmarchaeota archaeon]|nr:DUF58 domain-containing protein [Candidatus Aenigmarchaeota archaeon]MDW8149255.1 DUF58 domain-containing protein [Candidatus Aenigmarchaeota archaeon]
MSSTLLITYIYPLIITPHIEIEKISIKPLQIYKGQKIILKIFLKNNSIIPLIIAKIKVNNQHFAQDIPKSIFYTKPKSLKELEIEIKAIKRGFIEKIDIDINVSLFFEIIPPIKKQIETAIYIYPNFSTINYQSVTNTSPENNIGLMYKLTEEGEFFSIREYQLDDIKKISWKHWAKIGKLVVKQKAQFTNPKLYFLINNISTNEENDEEFIEKVNTFLKYIISNNIEINISTLEKINEFQKITDLKNSLVFLSKITFLKTLPEIEKENLNNKIVLTDQNRILNNTHTSMIVL